MTQNEITEFWRTQTILTMSDLDANKNMKPESMERIAAQCNFTIVPGKTYSFKEACDLITQAEIAKRKPPVEEKKEESPASIIVSAFKLLNDHGKSDNVEFVATALKTKFSKISLPDIMEGIKEATNQGLTNSGDEILTEYRFQRSLDVLSSNYEIASQKLQEKQATPEEIVKRFSNFFYQNYSQYKRFGKVHYQLLNSTLPVEVKNQIVDQFYERLAIDIEKKYSKFRISEERLAQEILKDYEDFDMERIFAILDTCNLQNVNIENVRYNAYCIEDEPRVIQDLKEMSSKKLNATDIVHEIENFGLEYPISFVAKTLEKMQQAGLILPYDTVFAIIAPEKVKPKQSEIVTVLLNASREKKNMEEIMLDLEELQPKYSNEEIVTTIQDMQRRGLLLFVPYEDLYTALRQKEAENEEKSEATDLIPIGRVPATLDLDKVEFVESEPGETLSADADIIDVDVLDADFEPISTGKRHKVVKREKAKTSIDKKAVVAAILVALGAVSTAVLSSVFNVSPLSAAKNTVTSIMSVATRNPALAQILPAVGDFVKNLSMFGMAATGTIAWLKRRNKKKTEQRKREIAEVLEEIMMEKEEAERGGKTR